MLSQYKGRIRSVACVLLLLIGFGLFMPRNQAVSESGSPELQELPDGYQLVADNERLSLYVDGANGYFHVCDKSTGVQWHSIPEDYEEDTIDKGITKTDVRSQLIVEYIAVDDVNTQTTTQKTNSQVMCVAKDAVEVGMIENGVRVVFSFADLGVTIPVEYTLHEDYLEASIDVAGIDEGEINYLVSIQLLPYMGAANQQQSGYLFIPDGCGAVAGFNRNIIPYADYRKMVYGDDMAIVPDTEPTKEETIRMPVFGTVIDGKGAMMGVITEGGGAAALIARTGSTKVNYNTVSSQCVYRIYDTGKSLYATHGNGTTDMATVTDTPFGLDRYTVRYYYLSGENASYVGMAETYRNYLINEKGLESNPQQPALALNVYGALEVEENFLGIKYNRKQPLTTFDETAEILGDLKAAGVENLSVQYIGWINNGVFNRKYPVSADPLSVLGGKTAFDDLVAYLNAEEIEYYPSVDFIDYAASGGGLSTWGKAAKAPNGDNARQYEYSLATREHNRRIAPWLLLSPASLAGNAEKFLKDYSRTGLSSIGLAEIGQTLYSDFAAGNGVFRSKSVELFESFLSGIEIADISVDGGNAYTLPFVDRVYETPVSSSHYDIFSYDVPFYQMVLHGHISYTTPSVVQSVDWNTMLLKSIEYGSDLLFTCVGTGSYSLAETRMADLYSSEYSLWKEEAVNYYQQYCRINALIWDQEIVGHASVGDECFKTEYANGVSVYVNYSQKDQVIDGISVAAQSYALKEAV